MKEIVTGIYTWSRYSEEKGIDFNGLFVRGSDGCVIVDPPPCSSEILDRMKELGPPTEIIITNRHHVRGARDIAAHFGIPIRINEADASLIDPPAAGTFRDGDMLTAGLKAIGVPDGKSPGETALHAAWAGALILGDALIGKPPGRLSMLPPEKFSDPKRAREGIRRLAEVQFDALLLGDGASFPQGGRAALLEFLSGD